MPGWVFAQRSYLASSLVIGLIVVLFDQFFFEPISEVRKHIEIDDCLMLLPCNRVKRLFEVDIGRCPANQFINGYDLKIIFDE